jgi:hypothetical protein
MLGGVESTAEAKGEVFELRVASPSDLRWQHAERVMRTPMEPVTDFDRAEVSFNLGRAVGGFGPLVVGALAAQYWSVRPLRCSPPSTCSDAAKPHLNPTRLRCFARVVRRASQLAARSRVRQPTCRAPASLGAWRACRSGSVRRPIVSVSRVLADVAFESTPCQAFFWKRRATEGSKIRTVRSGNGCTRSISRRLKLVALHAVYPSWRRNRKSALTEKSA